MSCYHPLTALWNGEYTATGKRKYLISGNVDPSRHGYRPYEYLDRVSIPCGQCIGCRLDYSRYWADRMMLEYETCGKAVFLTLTYDDEHLKDNVCMQDDDGSPLFYTLSVSDCQTFMKELRREFAPTRIRFCLSGEYGPMHLRPHYHLILFGVSLDDFKDKVFLRKSDQGFKYYRDPIVEKCWKKGYSLLADVSWNTFAYVSRYVISKLKGFEGQIYEQLGQKPPFFLMSRRPGIGMQYLVDHPDCLDDSKIVLSSEDGSVIIPIPKYFLKQLNNEKNIDFFDPVLYNKLKEDRMKAADDKFFLELCQTDLEPFQYLSVKESDKKVFLRKEAE